MNNLEKVTTLELVNRINKISIEINNLDMEYNTIVDELYRRFPNLKHDPNLEKKKIKEKTNGRKF